MAYYLDYELNSEELLEVEMAVGEPVEAVRIPWLLPLDQNRNNVRIAPEIVRPHLQRAGILRCRGRRVILVAPLEASWYVSLAEAIQRETGFYPLLIQTPRHRERARCPGPLRIIDMEAYMMDGDTTAGPPWLAENGPVDDGLLPNL